MKAFVFPGQGAQFVGMGKDLYENNAEARAMFEKANEILGFRITDLMFEGTDEQRDSIKSDAFTREADGLPYRSFTPRDDWKPKSPEPEKSKSDSEEEDSGGWFDWITRKTPQKEAALRDVRNNPNIPEGAKP